MPTNKEDAEDYGARASKERPFWQRAYGFTHPAGSPPGRGARAAFRRLVVAFVLLCVAMTLLALLFGAVEFVLGELTG